MFIEGMLFVQGVISLILVITFFFMAANVSKIRKMMQASMFPDGISQVLRLCPHCKELIQIEATVCAHCNRDLEPWFVRDGRWWTRNDAGEEMYLDTRTNNWLRPEPGP